SGGAPPRPPSLACFSAGLFPSPEVAPPAPPRTPPGPLDGLADHGRCQVVGPLSRQHTAVAPDGRAHATQDDRATHALRLAHEVELNALRKRSERLAAPQQLGDGLPPLLAVVAREVVHVHAAQ